MRSDVAALLRAASRQLLWTTWVVVPEVRRWRRRALHIPDVQLRVDALGGLRKRANIDGAVLFATTAKRWSRDLLAVLISYEVLADTLDCISERGAKRGLDNGIQLHKAMTESLDPGGGLSDYCGLHSSRQDGGHLRALVLECRSRAARLRGFQHVAHTARSAAALAAEVLPLNHEPAPDHRDQLLARWAALRGGGWPQLAWFERTGAPSAWLTVLVMLALADEDDCDSQQTAALYSAYLPWVSLAGTMLDSASDLVADDRGAQHSYIAHYVNTDAAVSRIAAILRTAAARLETVPNPAGHRVLLCCMTAMYLTKAGSQLSAGQVARLALSAGPLTRPTMPLLRLWRAMFAREEDQPVVRDEDTPSPDGKGRFARARLPSGSPLPAVAQTYLFWRDAHSYLHACRRRYGSTFTVRPLKSPPLVFTADPTAAHAILKAAADVLHPGQGGAVIEPLVGSHSFMLADEEAHLVVRRAISPAFKRSAVHHHAPMVQAICEEHIGSWPLWEPFAAHPRLRALTLAVILHALFGERDIAELHRALLRMFDITSRVVLQEPPLRHLPGWHGAWQEFLAARSHARTLLAQITTKAAGAPSAGPLAMLAGARNADGSPMSSDQVQSNLMSLILAGHETTASQLAWALQLLAHNPNVQATLRAAIDRGESSYLTAAIQEVLRHRNVFLFAIPRAATMPVQIGQRAYHPPVHLLPCIHLIHHNPDVYERPDLFLPERFLNRAPPHRHWVPWGGGRRRCPGRHLAMLEMQAVLRALLTRATVSPAFPRLETARWRSVIVTPEHGCSIMLDPRKRPHISTRLS